MFNIESQPDASILEIAADLKKDLAQLHRELPPDMHLAFFYDQSQFVQDSVSSVWSAIIFGLILSVFILYFFLKNWGSVWTAIVTIPISVLITFVVMKLTNMSFNMMTLGGIAASIGLIIDNAIVVVEAMCHRLAAGGPRLQCIHEAMGEILTALIGSTLTPVVVFLPLAYLGQMPGVFFRALGLTMVVSLLVSLALAVTLTPSLAAWLIRGRTKSAATGEEAGFVLRPVLQIYEAAVRWALRHAWLTLLACGLVFVASIFIFRQLETGFLPNFDEGGFVMDYTAPPGTSLAETSRILNEAEQSIRTNADVEGYSRRLGTQLGPFITEPYVGDYLIKLKANRKHTTEEVLDAMRHDFDQRFPMMSWDFHGYLDDLIGDLQMAPDPIQIKLFSPNMAWLQNVAPRVEEQIQKIPGVVDTFDGLTETGPSINLRVRPADAERFGLTAQNIADAVNTALLGQVSSYMLQGDRIVNIRVVAEPQTRGYHRQAAQFADPHARWHGRASRAGRRRERGAQRGGIEPRRFAAERHRVRAAGRRGLGHRHAGGPEQVEPGPMAAARLGRVRRLVSPATGILPQSCWRCCSPPFCWCSPCCWWNSVRSTSRLPSCSAPCWRCSAHWRHCGLPEFPSISSPSSA